MCKSNEKIIANKVTEYLPVDGCEECELFETACFECVAYGEAKEVERDNA